MRPTISSCTIVKNEERNIDELLDTVAAFADEIIIVDTGSTDKTLEKIREKIPLLKVPVVLTSFVEQPFHYGKAKNVSMRLATKEYTVIIDADFRLGTGFTDGLRDFLAAEQPHLATFRIIDEYVPSLIVTPVSIARRASNLLFTEDPSSIVHEHFEGIDHYPIKHFQGAMIHCQREDHPLVNPQRALFQMKLAIDREEKTASAFWCFLRGLRRGWGSFRKYYFFRRGIWRDGNAGFKYAFLVGYNDFIIQFFIGLKATPAQKKQLDERSPLR